MRRGDEAARLQQRPPLAKPSLESDDVDGTLSPDHVDAAARERHGQHRRTETVDAVLDAGRDTAGGERVEVRLMGVQRDDRSAVESGEIDRLLTGTAAH